MADVERCAPRRRSRCRPRSGPRARRSSRPCDDSAIRPRQRSSASKSFVVETAGMACNARECRPDATRPGQPASATQPRFQVTARPERGAAHARRRTTHVRFRPDGDGRHRRPRVHRGRVRGVQPGPAADGRPGEHRVHRRVGRLRPHRHGRAGALQRRRAREPVTFERDPADPDRRHDVHRGQVVLDEHRRRPGRHRVGVRWTPSAAASVARRRSPSSSSASACSIRSWCAIRTASSSARSRRSSSRCA